VLFDELIAMIGALYQLYPKSPVKSGDLMLGHPWVERSGRAGPVFATTVRVRRVHCASGLWLGFPSPVPELVIALRWILGIIGEPEAGRERIVGARCGWCLCSPLEPAPTNAKRCTTYDDANPYGSFRVGHTRVYAADPIPQGFFTGLNVPDGADGGALEGFFGEIGAGAVRGGDLPGVFADAVVEFAQSGFDLGQSSRKGEDALVDLGDLAREDLDVMVRVADALFEVPDPFFLRLGGLAHRKSVFDPML